MRKYPYNIAEPLTIVYDLIDDLQLLVEVADTPYTDRQLVSFTLEILCNTNNLTDGIKA